MTKHRSMPMLVLLALVASAWRWPEPTQNVAAWVLVVMAVGGFFAALAALVSLAVNYLGEARVLHKGDPEYDAFERARLDLVSRRTDLTDADRAALRDRLNLGNVGFTVERGVYVTSALPRALSDAEVARVRLAWDAAHTWPRS